MNPRRLMLPYLFPLVFAAACAQAAPQAVSPADTHTATPPTASPINPAATLPLQPRSTRNALPQATETAQPHATVPAQPQSTATALPQAKCTDSASFVADVTIPDKTTVSAGKAFLKTWRIRNTGTCTWNDSYSTVFVDGDQMNGIAAIRFKSTVPGATLDVSVDLVAPAVDGAYTGNYELHNAAGQVLLVDNTRTIWVKITVGTGTARQANSAVGTVSATSTPVTGSAGACTFTEDSGVENDLVSQVNAARAAYDLPALQRNASLSAAALSHSVDMACHSSISHSGSDGSTISGRMAAYGYSNSYWNEAIFAQPPEYGGTAQTAVDWWLNDPSHRVIILSKDAKDIGPGYAYVAGSKLGGYFTIDIGAPAP